MKTNININNSQALLEGFKALPREVKLPTYLEICRYPYSRFEEVCSRILSFFLHPGGEHGFKDLFLKSLLQQKELFPDRPFSFRPDKVDVLLEDNAEGKRIDIVVKANGLVIGIENKITAGLYNPLQTYAEHLAKLGGRGEVCKVVLSLSKITSREEKREMERHGFINITYSALFEAVKQSLGFYLNGKTSHYLPYLQDFIITIENMQGNNIFDQQTADFFYENSEALEELVEFYKRFKGHILTIQSAQIKELRDRISDKTGAEWWIYEGYDLGYNSFEVGDYYIGIESDFQLFKKDPLGKFSIAITTWNVKSWNFYESELRSHLPNLAVERGGGKVYTNFESILGYNEEDILTALEKAFAILAQVVQAKNN